jgi:hypothetical protein
MPIYLDLSRKSMPSPKTTTHPPSIWYEAESQIKTIERANQNLALIIVEKRKIKKNKLKNSKSTKKDGPCSSSPPAGRPEGREQGQDLEKATAAELLLARSGRPPEAVRLFLVSGIRWLEL